MPVNGNASCAVAQSEAPSRTPVSNAMIAKVGAAARDSQSAGGIASHAARLPVVCAVIALLSVPPVSVR